MANTSSAYDLSAFAPQPRQNKAQNPDLKVLRNKRRVFFNAVTPKVFCAFSIVVTLVCLIVYNQVCLNEVMGDINRLNKEFSILESESVRFSSLLESTASLRAIAQQAEEDLGMSKLDQFQTVYVYLYEKDQIVISEQPEQEADDDGILAIFGSIINNAKEYIAGS